MTDPASASPASDASRLDHLSHWVVRGADARSFLDGQLTRDVPPAGDQAIVASLAGYCSPKGRLLASFTVWAEADAIHLLMSRDLADGVVKRLRMYVLRAKATFEDATASTALEGFVDPRGLPSEVESLVPWAGRRVGDAWWIRHPDADGSRRFLRVRASDAADGTPAPVDAATWRWSEVRAGLPRIVAATQDRFVPQMINLEALGAVDFRKGCFPGQEVVARSQYLGKLKRRTALAELDATAALPPPGTDVYLEGLADPQGVLVNVESAADGRVAALVELAVAQLASPIAHAGAPEGPPLRLAPVPYPLPDNQVFVRPKL